MRHFINIVEGREGLAPLTGIDKLVSDFGMLITFNFAHISQAAKDPASAKSLEAMVMQFSKPAINGVPFPQLQPTFYRDPKAIPAVLKFIYHALIYIRGHFEKCLAEPKRTEMLTRLTKVEDEYRNYVKSVSKT